MNQASLSSASAVRGATLRVRGLHKRFGGIAAVDGANLEIEAGELHALIGPNGAGKSTLVNLLAGALAADGGSILLDGEEIGGLPMHQRVARGLARSYQITSIFSALSVADNVALALQARSGATFSMWRPRMKVNALHTEVEAVLSQVELSPLADRLAARLAHGEQRKLELALALATGARIFLLDEPLAGMGEQEGQAMIELIARLKGAATVVLIEHDMDAVFRLADRISVLVAGKVIATGTEAAIRADAQVQAAYLGDETRDL
jgi:branched-chain amino acid transport system ATP-binding protein